MFDNAEVIVARLLLRAFRDINAKMEKVSFFPLILLLSFSFFPIAYLCR